MKRLKIILTTVFMTISLIGVAENYTVETGQFEKLKINGNLRLVYSNLPDSTGFARYEAPVGNSNIYSFSIKKDGTLKVEPSDEKWGDLDLPTVYVYSDFLSSVESYSELSVDIRSISPNSTFSVTQVGNGTITVENLRSKIVKASINTGNGSIYLSGQCETANLRMVGSGLISADRLSADDVKCRVIGTGSIGCWPIDNLTVTGLGSTKIYYKGRPNIKKTLGGKLYELPGEAVERYGTEVKSLNPVEDDPEEIEKEEEAEEKYKSDIQKNTRRRSNYNQSVIVVTEDEDDGESDADADADDDDDEIIVVSEDD